MLGTVFNIQRFSLFDGPGVRTVVFLKGCPLRCIWCHNPEGLTKTPQILFNAKKCIGCAECVNVCPHHQHIMKDGLHAFLRAGCVGCGKCAKSCCTEALSVAGKLMDAEAVIASVMRDEGVFRESGGGMTLSGGEPLMQGEFATELLRMAKERGIGTCVETCGHVKGEVISAAAEYTDLFYYDYKATGDALHRELCGVSQSLILENLTLLDSLGASVVLRCPVVVGKNDTPEHIMGIAHTARDHSSVEEVQLEPYHRLGISKSESLGETATYDGRPPERAFLEECVRSVTENSGKKCTIS